MSFGFFLLTTKPWTSLDYHERREKIRGLYVIQFILSIGWSKRRKQKVISPGLLSGSSPRCVCYEAFSSQSPLPAPGPLSQTITNIDPDWLRLREGDMTHIAETRVWCRHLTIIINIQDPAHTSHTSHTLLTAPSRVWTLPPRDHCQFW